MIDQRDLDPDQDVLLVARTADGPAIRVPVRTLRLLTAAGLLEPSPNGGLQISDKGIEYARRYRKQSPGVLRGLGEGLVGWW